MTRLQTEWQRLFLSPGADTLNGPDGRVRALVLEIAGPADWAALGRVWLAVQRELDLPEPAIAVSGSDGLQLWFSLQDAVPVAQARHFLQGLAQRHLAELPHAARRLRLWPRADGQHTAPIPAECAAEQWSAFVAPDLAPVFADTPWLDIPPGPDGQADLLRRLVSITPAAWAAALQALAADPEASAPATATPHKHGGPVPAPGPLGPRQFLRQVLNDAQAPLALRIEAAKALLPYDD